MRDAVVTGLIFYPVKSMRGIALERAVLTKHGLRGDRRWMVVRESGRFVTQRDLPRLALVHTSQSDSGVKLSMDGRGSLTVPFEHSGGTQIRTKVWKDHCETIDEGEEVSKWLTSALESSEVLRLVRMAPGFVRPQSQPENLGKQTSTFFADAAPFLVANEASLAALNRELESRELSTVPMNRFRPNIVIRGLEPFAEHRVSELSSKGCALKLCHPCQRCVVTTIDQDSAVKNPDWQPYKTLRDINPMPGNERAPAFGQNAILHMGEGTQIRLGDSVFATERSGGSQASL